MMRKHLGIGAAVVVAVLFVAVSTPGVAAQDTGYVVENDTWVLTDTVSVTNEERGQDNITIQGPSQNVSKIRLAWNWTQNTEYWDDAGGIGFGISNNTPSPFLNSQVSFESKQRNGTMSGNGTYSLGGDRTGEFYLIVDEGTGTVKPFNATQNAVSGTVYECPSSDCNPSEYTSAPGVGSDARAVIFDPTPGFGNDPEVINASTSSDGLFTAIIESQSEYDPPYTKYVLVNGEVRWSNRVSTSLENISTTFAAPMEGPTLSDFAPADNTEVTGSNVTLSANLSDVDFPSDEVTVEWFDGTDDSKIGEDVLSGNGTASTNWNLNQSGNYAYYVTATDKYNYTNIYVSQTRTFTATQEAVAPWELKPATASPRGNEFVDESHTHSIDIANLSGNDVRVRFYNDTGIQIGADTVSGNGTQTADISHTSSGAGSYGWYAVAEDLDSGIVRSTSTFAYRVAGGLRVRDADSGNLIQDRTAEADITVAGTSYDVQVNDGRIDYDTDIPSIPTGSFVADVDAQGYYGTSLNIFDAATVQDVYLQKRGTDDLPSEPDGDFDVQITDSNEPVQASETGEVEVTVTNNIDTTQSGTLTFYVEGNKTDYKTIQQQGGQQQVYTFSWTPTTSGNKDILVESGTDSDTMKFNVNAAPSPGGNFSVDITDTNSPVDEREMLTVNVSVTDRTGSGTSGTLVGEIDGGTAASTSVSLNASETENVTLSWNTDLNDAGEYNFTAVSGCADAVCSDNTTVQVVEVQGVAGVPPEDILNVIFTLEDRTGDFTPVSETTLIVQRRINGSWSEVNSGEFGAANQFQTSVIRNEPYNLVVRNDNNIRDIGGFRTNVSGEFELVINARTYPTDEPRPWRWNATYVEDTDQIKFSYTDKADATQTFNIDIYEYGNSANYLFRKTVNDTLGTYEYSQVLTQNQSKSRWVVAFCATRNGTEICREKVVGSGVDDIFGDAPDWLLEIFGAIVVMLVAGIFSTVNAKVGAIVTLSFAGLLYAVGILASAITGLAIAGALAIAIIYKAGDNNI